MPKPDPAAFRRQALALLDEGRTVRDVAASLWGSPSHVCTAGGVSNVLIKGLSTV